MSFIKVRYTTGHLEVISVDPNAPLIRALEAACFKRSLDPTKHKLIYHKKRVDESVSFRYSGLLNQANLELVPLTEDELSSQKPSSSKQASQAGTETLVRVCIRLEDGHRSEWKGTVGTPLWDVLESIRRSDDKISQLLSVSTDALAPCLVYLNQKVCGEAYLRATTLSGLGIQSGAVLFQLTRNTPPLAPPPTSHHAPVASTSPVPMDTASPSQPQPSASQPSLEPQSTSRQPTLPVGEVSTVFPNREGAFASAGGGGGVEPFSIFGNRNKSMFGGNQDVQPKRQKPSTLGEILGISLAPDTSIPNVDSGPGPLANFKFPTATEGKNLLHADKDSTGLDEPPFCPPCERETILFRRNLSPDTATESTSSEEVSDDFFDLSPAELRRVIAQLRKSGGVDAAFTDHSQQQETSAEFFAKFQRCVIRFVWSDDYVLQACFQPQERVSALYDFVREQLASAGTQFQLYTTPPKEDLVKMDSTLIKAHLVPFAQVFIKGAPKASTMLKPSLVKAVTTDGAAEATAIARGWMAQRLT